MDFLNDFFVVIVVVICLCVGYILKHFVTSDKVNKFIPLIVGVLGVVINAWLNAWTFTPDVLACGLVSGLGSTGLHQLFKQFIEKKATVEPEAEPEVEGMDEVE